MKVREALDLFHWHWTKTISKFKHIEIRDCISNEKVQEKRIINLITKQSTVMQSFQRTRLRYCNRCIVWQSDVKQLTNHWHHIRSILECEQTTIRWQSASTTIVIFLLNVITQIVMCECIHFQCDQLPNRNHLKITIRRNKLIDTFYVLELLTQVYFTFEYIHRFFLTSIRI